MRHVKKPPKLPPSDDDIWLDVLHIECGRAMARWLRDAVNLDRQIKTLTLADFKALSSVCEAQWLKLVSKRLADGDRPFSDAEREAYLALLSG